MTSTPSETIYIRNLNEKIKIPKLKDALRDKFSLFGDIIDVVAHKNIRMRGQAFIVFDQLESAEKAKDAMNDHEIFDKRMIVQFSKSPSDATVQKQGLDQFLAHKQARLAAKQERQDATGTSKKRKGNSDTSISTKKMKQDFGREPPNKILFLQHLPDDITKEYLDEMFSKYKGFIEVRLFAVRHVGFIEYEDEQQATTARMETSSELSNKGIQMTYAKK